MLTSLLLVVKGGLVLQKNSVHRNLQQESAFSIGDVRAATGLLQKSNHQIDVEIDTSEDAIRLALQQADEGYRDGRELAEIGWARAMADVALARHETELALAAEQADRAALESRSIDTAADKTKIATAQRNAELKTAAATVLPTQAEWAKMAEKEGMSTLDWVQTSLDLAGLGDVNGTGLITAVSR